MSLAWYGCKLTVHHNATLEVGWILATIVAMITAIIIVTYIWSLYSIKHYGCIFRASIAIIKRMRVQKILALSGIYFSLYITIRSLYCMSVCLLCQEICTHTKVKQFEMFPALHGLNFSDEKYGYFASRGDLETTILLWLPIIRW